MKAVIESKTAIVLLTLALIVCMCHAARSADFEGPHHFNVVFTPETTAQEVIWQALNVVDGMQTVYIADHAAKYEEVTSAWCVGAHPSRGAAIVLTAGMAVLHYAVTVGIENLVQENPDYRVLQRVWEYSSLTYKVSLVAQNHAYGIKP